MTPKSGPAHVLSLLSPTPSSGTRPLPYMARPPGVTVIDGLCKREQDAKRKEAALQLACSRPVWWLWSTFISDELLQGWLCQQLSPAACCSLPIAVRLFESGLTPSPLLPHGRLEAVGASA